MTPPVDWIERIVHEVQFGLLPYCEAVEEHALLWLTAALLLAGLAWWAQRTADRSADGPAPLRLD